MCILFTKLNKLVFLGSKIHYIIEKVICRTFRCDDLFELLWYAFFSNKTIWHIAATFTFKFFVIFFR